MNALVQNARLLDGGSWSASIKDHRYAVKDDKSSEIGTGTANDLARAGVLAYANNCDRRTC